MALLRVLSGDNKNKIYPIESDRLTIGRDSKEIPVVDQGVSREHAEIFRIGETYLIRDLGSRNGTFVNNNKVEDQEILRVGDRVHVGNTELVFEDRFPREMDSRIIRFGDSIEKPDSTISFRLDRSIAQTGDSDAVSKDHSQLETLYKVTRYLGTGRDLHQSLESIAREMSSALNADHVYLFAFDEQGEDEFHLVAGHDRHPVEELAVSRSILKQVRDESRPVLSSDATLDDRFTTSESIVMKKIKSLLCVPLVAMSRPIGAFYATNSKLSEVFSPEDLTLATTIGMMVGNAVEMHDVLATQGSLYRNTLKTLAAAAALRTPQRRGRSERVATHAAAIARGLGMTVDKIRTLWIAGLLCDIGALALSDAEIKNAINAEQRKAKLAAELLSELQDLKEIAPAVRHHTERFDGSGFPEGLKGDDIPLEAEIVGLACEFEDLLSGTDDEEGLSVKEALIRLRDQSGTTFSGKVVNALLIAYRRNLLFQEDRRLFASGFVSPSSIVIR